MPPSAAESSFKALLQRPADSGGDQAWGFLRVPKAVSDRLPRRGRTSVIGTLNGHPFQATLEPDGALGHWMKVYDELCIAAKVAVGETVTLKIAPVAQEPEPSLPADFQQALAACAPAQATWDATTTLARVDWIHWVESAKQAKTRRSRIANACDMLASGKKRVCCFDPSGFYSKSLGAPRAAD